MRACVVGKKNPATEQYLLFSQVAYGRWSHYGDANEIITWEWSTIL